MIDISDDRRVLKTSLAINFAIGIMAFYATVLVLYIINYCIYSSYHPDIVSIVKQMTALSLRNDYEFAPEPVERLQFVVSVVSTPFLVILFSVVFGRLRNFLAAKTQVAQVVNIAGVNLLVLYLAVLFQRRLVQIDDTNTRIFANNLAYRFNFIVSVIFYLLITLCFFAYLKKEEAFRKIVKFVSIELVCLILLQTVLYNVFHLAVLDSLRTTETNAVYYSITQVFAGKTLLVNLNCQYGLYAWFLYPLFKLIGLNTISFSLVMGMLNAFSFLLIYFGLKKIIKQDLLCLITFLALIFWQCWQTKLPFESNPRFYYQYWPIRILFPSIAFYLVARFFTNGEKRGRYLLPIIAFTSAVAVLWNLDSGVVVFGAVLLSLLYYSLHEPTVALKIGKLVAYGGWMLGSLACVVGLFILSTKINSGAWPDFAHFSHFQQFFYISGYFMMPMTAWHFWNLPMIIYLIALIYPTYRYRTMFAPDKAIIVFLAILGLGLFSYFQGRSYDTNITLVIYPAIILAGIFCDELLIYISERRLNYHMLSILFFILFFFLLDGAFSMVGYMPAMQTYAWNSAFYPDAKAETVLKDKLHFIKTNIHKGDRILVFADDYDSYYYNAGDYRNAADVPGTTEMFFRSELYAVLDSVRSQRYPILYDASMHTRNSDTVLKTLMQNAYIVKQFGPHWDLLLLSPKRNSPIYAFDTGKNFIDHYSRLGYVDNPYWLFPKLMLPDTFKMEFFISKLDTTRLSGSCWMFYNSSDTMKNSGIKLVQQTNDLTVFCFSFGNGKEWIDGPKFHLSCSQDNYLVIRGEKGSISAYNNGTFYGTVNTGNVISNNPGVVNLNPEFPGVVNEVKVYK